MSSPAPRACLCLLPAFLSACAPALNGNGSSQIRDPNAYLLKSNWVPYPGAVPFSALTDETPHDTPVLFSECQNYAVKLSEVRSVGPEQAHKNCAELQAKFSSQFMGGTVAVLAVGGALMAYLLVIFMRILTG